MPFPKGLSGYQMIRSMMSLHGFSGSDSEERTWNVIERVGMTDAAHRRVAGYSKGMRQRVRLAQALAHTPKVLILDEPLNGLDPMARAEVIDLFRKFAESGMHVVISSHIMHEVDIVSDSVIMMSGGYVVAEGDIQGVRHEMEEHPIQILIRCDRPGVIAASVFQQDSVVEVEDPSGRTRAAGIHAKSGPFLRTSEPHRSGESHRRRGCVACGRKRQRGLPVSGGIERSALTMKSKPWAVWAAQALTIMKVELKRYVSGPPVAGCLCRGVRAGCLAAGVAVQMSRTGVDFRPLRDVRVFLSDVRRCGCRSSFRARSCFHSCFAERSWRRRFTSICFHRCGAR